MPTDHNLETIIGAMYLNAMKHLQQLIMDSEDCAKKTTTK